MKSEMTMPLLSYEANALEPVISEVTIVYHYGKHLKTYVDNLNRLKEGTEFANASLEDMAANAQGAIGNNAGQVLNHSLYFEQFSPVPSKNAPEGNLSAAIVAKFGTFDEFKAQMNAAATSLFGSGWAWLCSNDKGELSIMQMANADNPLRHNLNPLLTFDVWEHAYYLDYQNRRAEYLNALWQIIDWNVVEQRYS